MTPFEIIPGDPASRVILHVPHASRRIPTSVRDGIALSDSALRAELDATTDARTDEIALLVAATCAIRPWIFVNRLSRLVIDPERFPDNREEMNLVGMGAVYSKTSTGGVLRRPDSIRDALLIAKYFTPYAAAFEQLVSERLDAIDQVTIIDVHSFPKEPLLYELHANGPRPPICIGTDEFHTPAHLRQSVVSAFASRGIESSVNSPFAGCYVPLSRFGIDHRVQGLMVEMRRDGYLTRHNTVNEFTAAHFVDAITRAIDVISSDNPIDRRILNYWDLMDACGCEYAADLAAVIEEGADLSDGSELDIDDSDTDQVALSLGTRGFVIEFPTTIRNVLALAEQLERLDDDVV